MQVNIIQCNISWQDADANLAYIESKLNELDSNADLVILAEMFTTGVTTKVENIAESMQGTTVTTLKTWAKQYNVALCGSILIMENGKYYNRFVFVTPENDVHTYDKRHLFKLGGEHKVLEAGSSCDIIKYRGWRIKPQICYDLRFPVWSRNTEKYDVLIYVANWPKSRDFAYHTLLKARAIENQAYVCACNRIGVDGNKIVYAGGSMVVDAKGNTLADAEDHEMMLSTELSRKNLDVFRERFTVLDDGDDFSISI